MAVCMVATDVSPLSVWTSPCQDLMIIFFFFFFPQSGHCTLHYILFFTSESPVLAVTVEKTGVDQNLLYGSSMGHEAAVEFDLPEECICSVGLSFPGKTYTCPLLFLYFCKFIFRRLLTKLMRKAHLDL